MSDSLIPSFLVSDVSESLRSLTKHEQMSESLVFVCQSLIRLFKNERFAQKTDERIPNPDRIRVTDLVRVCTFYDLFFLIPSNIYYCIKN